MAGFPEQLSSWVGGLARSPAQIIHFPRRFNAPPLALRRRRVLTNAIRELQADGLIGREVYDQVPAKVEFSLSPRGHSLAPGIRALKDRGDANVDLSPAAALNAA